MIQACSDLWLSLIQNVEIVLYSSCVFYFNFTIIYLNGISQEKFYIKSLFNEAEVYLWLAVKQLL